MHQPHIDTHAHQHTRATTHSLPNFYWTRIQLLNPAPGSVPSLLLHLDKSALISADSLCPPCTRAHTHSHRAHTHSPTAHTHEHTADPHKSLIKWKPRCPFLHPRVNEYQWETDTSPWYVTASMRMTKKKEGELLSHLRAFLQCWICSFVHFFSYLFFFQPRQFICLHDIWIFIVPSP